MLPTATTSKIGKILAKIRCPNNTIMSDFIKDMKIHFDEDSSDYIAYVNKFKHQRTQDDSYTPDAVYDVVIDWVRARFDLSGCNIVRPFYPGGNYQAVNYGKNDVVIDNPPFSILSEIIDFYTKRDILFSYSRRT